MITTKLLLEISIMASGGTPSRKNKDYWNGNIPWVTTAEVSQYDIIIDTNEKITELGLQNSSAKLFPKDSILLALYGQGKTRGKVSLLGIPAATNQACLSIQPDTSLIKTKYLYYYLDYSYEKLRKMANSGGQDNLSMAIVKEFPVKFPNISVQEYRINLFDKLSKKIQLQQEKIDLLKDQKKGFMHRIFSQDLRFKNACGNKFPEWNTFEFHSLVEPVKGNSLKNIDNTKLPILTISAKSGFVNQQDRFSEVIAGNSLSKYTELEMNGLSYNKGNSKTAKYGCVYVQSKYQKALVPNVYKSFKAKKNVNPFYIQYLFATKLLDRQLKGIISSTARMDGLLNVSDEDFYNINIPCPSFEEQNKIVDFLSTFNLKIEVEEKKLEGLMNQKKAFMQQMFI